MSQTDRLHNSGTGSVDHSLRRHDPYEDAKVIFAAILKEANNPKNDIHNADFWALGRGEHAGDVSGAIKLDRGEMRKLTAGMERQPEAQIKLMLERVLPERLAGSIHDGIFLTKNAAADLTKYAKSHGVHVKYEARMPVLPVAAPQLPGSGGPTHVPSASPIEGIVAIGEIKSSAPADPKMVGRINEISSMVMAKEAGKGKNVLASVVNILDMIAPVAVSLLPTASDDAGTASLKQTSLKAMKKDLHGEHLSDKEFIHQLQVIHAQLLQYKGMVTLGNEIAVDSGSRLRPEVEEAVKKTFDVKVSSLPMQSNPDAAAAAMNASIEKATTVYAPPKAGETEPKKVKDGLKDVVKPDFVSNLDAASIATFTALLDWRYVFDEAQTKENTVHSANGSEAKKKLMTLQTGYRTNPASREREEVPKMEAAESNGFTFVKMPYDDKEPPPAHSFGPPPSKIYRIIGAPSVSGSNREKRLAEMVKTMGTHDPLELSYEDRHGKIVMPRVQAEGEADPFDLLADAGVNAKAWSFPLLQGEPVKFTKGIHKGAAEDTEKGTIVQFVTVGGVRATSIDMSPHFEMRADVPYYNAIVVELKGPRGESLPLKVAEWTIEDFSKTQDPTSTR